MKIRVNGTERVVPDDLNVAELLRVLALPVARVAVERNREIVPKDRREATAVEDGDAFEIVTLVGGG